MISKIPAAEIGADCGPGDPPRGAEAVRFHPPKAATWSPSDKNSTLDFSLVLTDPNSLCRLCQFADQNTIRRSHRTGGAGVKYK